VFRRTGDMLLYTEKRRKRDDSMVIVIWEITIMIQKDFEI
jgi:hypothetical protein